MNIGKPKKWDYPVFEAGESSKAVFRRLKERTVQRYVEEGYQKQSGAQAKYDTNYKEKTKPFLFSMSLQERLFCKFMEDFRAKSRRDVLDVYVSSYFNAWLDYQDLYRNSDTVKYWSVFSACLASTRTTRNPY